MVGMPWYRREDWAALRELLVDAHKLQATWEDWHRNAASCERLMTISGYHIVRALIRPKPFALWCETLGIPTDSAARTRWSDEVALRKGRLQS